MHRVLLVGLLIASSATGAPVPKTLKAAPLDGRWEIAEMWYNGTDITASNRWVWDIDGNKLTISIRQSDKSLIPLEVKVVSTLFPPEKGEAGELDYRREGNGADLLFHGRVRVDGDELVFVHDEPDKPRPTELTTKARYYNRFTRVATK